MARLIYGARNPRLVFASDADFFETYGFLCNDNIHRLEFQWEYNANSGAWGNEGRIHFLQTNIGAAYNPMPIILQNRLTAGRGNIANRLNCNDFITELVNSYGFQINPSKPGNLVTRSAQGLLPPLNPTIYVPQQYLNDYQRGYNM